MTTTPDIGAFEAMLAHHAALEDGVGRRVAALEAAVDGGGAHGTASAELLAYLAKEVLPHAMAEEHTLYRAAAAREELAEAVAGMVDEHRRLVSLADQLATADNAAEAATDAQAIGALFRAHVRKENELVLPPLAAAEDVDLTDLLIQMHRLVVAAQDETPTAQDVVAPDTETSLLGLVLDAARQLADAGRGDGACRLAANAWAVVRVGRPDLAIRVTAALHRLVRSVTAEPVFLSSGPSTPVARQGEVVLDVRSLAPAQRHEKIFATYHALGVGGAFVLVNDHDPKPLRYQFEAEHAGAFTWDALEDGPTVWRVRIGRQDAMSVGSGKGGRGDMETTAEPELDVRRFPHGQRHDVIFTTYGALAEGAGFVLVNDHDPLPLRYQFEAQHQGRYSWDYLETGPDVWRVRIGRPAVVPA